MPKRSHPVGLAIATILVAAAVAGCTATSSTSSAEWPGTPIALSSTPQSTLESRVAPDYRRLLIEPGDINTGTDTFAIRSSTTNPGGADGVSALFVNQADTRAIGDTILILPDSAAATTTLNTTVSSIGTVVTGGSPQPSPVGTGGPWFRVPRRTDPRL